MFDDKRKWKWNLTEVSSHDETGSALKKNYLITLQHGPQSARMFDDEDDDDWIRLPIREEEITHTTDSPQLIS